MAVNQSSSKKASLVEEVLIIIAMAIVWCIWFPFGFVAWFALVMLKYAPVVFMLAVILGYFLSKQYLHAILWAVALGVLILGYKSFLRWCEKRSPRVAWVLGISLFGGYVSDEAVKKRMLKFSGKP